MRTIRLTLQAPHSNQAKVLREAARFNVLCCGRRWGKTNLGIKVLLKPALQGHPTAWFSPTYKMMAEVWREFRRTLRPVTKSVNKAERRIELLGGGFIEFWSLDRPATVRGRKYKAVAIDEAAMVAGLADAWQEVIRPTLTDYRGGAWFLSTPAGVNFFHTLFAWGQDPTKPLWRSWQMPTTSNPTIEGLAAEVEDARQELPEAKFRQEYLAEFLQGEGSVFRRVSESLIEAYPEQADAIAAHAGHRKVIGGDWAQKDDFSCFSAVCADCKIELELDRFNQISWALQRTRLRAMNDRWEPEEILLEENSIGGPNLEALANEGLPVRGFKTTPQTKPPLIQSLALAFERLEHRWLNVPVATAEAVAYESKVNPTTGHTSYSAPKGQHDDTVIARALARKSALASRRAENSDQGFW